MKYLKIYLFTLLENWERNNNSADMQPCVALFIPASCNSLESWDYCPGEGETEAGSEDRSKITQQARGRAEAGTHVLGGILPPTHSDTLPSRG